jgi:signal transduction histidine kinase/DNA-binding response OmpR family regulator
MPRPTNILVIDDNVSRLKTLSAKLRNMGHRVTTATKGQEAVALFSKQPFNIVLADIKLPDVSGREILETTKELNPEVAVIMMTDRANLKAAVNAVEEGAYAYILKPEAMYELKTLISNALREQELLIRNRKLVDGLQQSNKLFSEANERLQKEINERKQAEELLKVEKNKLQSLIDAMEYGLTIQDRDYNIIYQNEPLRSIFGVHLGEKCYRVYEGKDKLCDGCPVGKAFRDGKSHTAERRVVLPSGEVTLWENTANPIRDAGGRIVSCLEVTRNITGRKLMEQEIQNKNEQLEMQNKELEKASRAKSDFLARMSHELRTPLNVIMGFSELMLDQVPGEINEEQRQCLDDMLTSSRHLLGLINEVLDLSKVEAGKVEVRVKDIALAELVGSVTSAMTAVLSQRKQSLDVDLAKGLPLVYADGARLRQVFFNLLSNASKFTPDGGKIRIEALRKDGLCQVTVSDNGIGIKKEDLKQIFEPFYQADNPVTRERKGTGLGLTLVKEIVEMHGGQIWVQSEYGKGSDFIFTLPLVAGEGTGAEEDTDCGR